MSRENKTGREKERETWDDIVMFSSQPQCSVSGLAEGHFPISDLKGGER